MNLKRDSFTTSPWQKTAEANKISKPATNASYDVIIIGAGITGLTTALKLQQAGKQCLLVDAGNLGFGTTGGTTAHINTFFDSTYPEIESAFNSEAAKLVADAGKLALETIEQYVKDYQIDCDLETKVGYLFSEDEKQSQQLGEIQASAKNAGVDVEQSVTNGVPISFQHSLKFEGQAQFHPLKYISALAKKFVELGGTFIEHTFITDVKQEDDRCVAISEQGIFNAEHLVYATHLPPGINKFSFRCSPYRSYALGITLSDESQYPNCLSYDMQEPYHYFRTHVVDGQKILILGGEDHKTGHGDPAESFTALEDYAKQYFQIKDIPYQWSSQYYVPVDGLPYIGRMNNAEDNIYVATGFNGNGMTWGTISGLLISGLILEKENQFAALFDPCRMKPIAGFTEFVKENADVAYHFVADRFTAEDLDSLAELQKDEGKVVDYNGEQIALYKDKEGVITALSPVCTHAKCIVNFNSMEKSWDCPCHGGRFDLDGKVLCGPPRENLKPIALSKAEAK
jgi:glycine/D-amino acid oxidase-like deaminating enzyme/nitrite reductase/ring-hydroxylating ferredoxin subunit